MRVTNNMMTRNLINNLFRNASRMSEFQRQLSTGKRISRPSDDPVGVANSLRLRTKLGENEQYRSNVEDAISFLQLTDTALQQVNSILQRARELAVRGANGSMAEGDRKALADEVGQLREQLVEVANTSYQGKYIFNGNKTLTAPYDKTAGWIDINHDQGKIEYEVAKGVNIQVNVLGNDVFGNGSTTARITGATPVDITQSLAAIDPGTSVAINIDGTDYYIANAVLAAIDGTASDATALLEAIKNADDGSGNLLSSVAYVTINTEGKISVSSKSAGSTSSVTWTIIDGAADTAILENAFGITNNTTDTGIDANNEKDNVFALLDGFIDRLNTGNLADISGEILSEIDNRINKVLSSLAIVGARENRLELTLSRIEDMKINFTELLQDNEDADFAEVIMKLKTEESVYRASLSVGGRVIQPSLIDFLN